MIIEVKAEPFSGTKASYIITHFVTPAGHERVTRWRMSRRSDLDWVKWDGKASYIGPR